MKTKNPIDCVDKLLEMAEFFKGSDPTLALNLRDTASRALDFVAYREYLAHRKMAKPAAGAVIKSIPKRRAQSRCTGVACEAVGVP